MEDFLLQENKDINWINSHLSFLVVTANDNEREAFETKFMPIKRYSKIVRYINRENVYRFGMFGNYLVLHLHLKDQGSLKPNASALSIHQAFISFDLKGVIMIGIAYGKDDNSQNFGDVLVCSKVQPVHSRKIATDANHQVKVIDRNITYEPGKIILNIFKNIDWKNSMFDNKLWFGTFLCGEELIDNLEYKNSLIKQFKDENNLDNIIGGEMEGSGLGAVMKSMEISNWMIVKGISDFADGAKKENKEIKQQLAAKNAVEYCYKIFSTKVLSQNIKDVKCLRPFKPTKIYINPFVLYYYKNKNRVPLNTISKNTDIDLLTLQKIENCEKEICIPEDKFKKLCNFLNLEETLLSSKKTQEKYIKFFENKNYKSFVPIVNSKVIFLDFDGTLTTNQNTTWEMIWEVCGYHKNFCKSYHRKFKSGDITHKEWCDITLEFFQKAKFNKSMMKQVVNKLSLINDCIETLEILKNNNVKLYIISGSIKEIIEEKFGKNSEIFESIRANVFRFDQNEMLESIFGTEYDFEGKAVYINKIISKYNYSIDDCIYLGNSCNDEFVYKTGIKTLLINPVNAQEYNSEIWNYLISDGTSLKEILPYVLPEQYTLKNIYEGKSIEEESEEVSL